MFENLSKREKTLAMVVFSILPIMVLFFAFTSVMNSYFAKRSEITKLQRQISDEQEQQTRGQLADQRLYYYESLSMSGGTRKKDIDNAKEEYRAWLINLVAEQLKMDFTSLKPGKSEDIAARGPDGKKVVGQRHPFKMKASGNINQLIDLVHELEKIDVLHRITKLSIKPKSDGPANKKTRTSSLGLQLDLELVSLLSADKDRKFLTSNQKPDFDVEKFRTQIANRNIFGLKNNAPSFKKISSRYLAVTEGNDVRFTISVDDKDKNDEWTYELLEKSVPEAELTPRKKSAQFRCPKLIPGQYKFKAKVSDNGLPSKSDVIEFTLTVNKKPPTPKRTVRVEPEPDPPFPHAGNTTIQGIVRDSDGVLSVWIVDLLTDQRFDLTEGESFQLDDKKWTVITIEKEVIEIEVDGEIMKFKDGGSLDEPVTP